MSKWIAGAVVVVALLAGAYFLLGRGASEPAAAAATPQPVVKANSDVVADARVVPVLQAALSFAGGGQVAEVLIAEGDAVRKGDILARLAAVRQSAAAAEARAGLGRAQARLAELKAGSRVQEVAAAQAALDAAKAQLAKIEQPAREEDIAAGQAELAAARATLQKVLEGADENQLIAARADLANAEAALRQAQAAYDEVKSSANIGALPQSLQLQQATNAFVAAQARYDELARGASAADIANARAQVQRAQAALDTLQAPARPADIAVAQAEIERAQAQFDLTAAGTRPETIAAAEADVAAAQAGLDQALAALADTEIAAPFDGVVVTLDLRPGEQVSAGVTVIQMADISAWRIETSDLTELSIVRIKEGDPASITFDAIPGLVMPGIVQRIQGFGESKQGDITYTVVVHPSQMDARLRWNMTASVTISPD